jgi:parallel beta-helix repeat protein
MNMKRMKRLLVAFAAICLFASSLSAFTQVTHASRTLYVPEEYPTINQALGNATDGDTIIVASGTYNERLTIDKAITLKGAGNGSTTINGNDDGTVILIQHDSVEVSDFNITYDETANYPKSIWMWSTRLAGIHLLNVKGCSIHDNNIQDCGGGIWLYGSSQNRITNNYLYRNNYGIRVDSSNFNTFQNNSAVGNWAGFSLFSSVKNLLYANSMSNNSENMAVTGDNPSFINYVDSSNTVDSKPVYYWIGKSHETVPSDGGYVVLLDCTDITVDGLNLSKNHDGIVIVNCLNINVSNNIISGTNGGIITTNSEGGYITGNNVNSSTAIDLNGNGYYISGNNLTATHTGVGTKGNYNTITANTVNSITPSAWYCNMVDCEGTYNTITDNWLNGTSYVFSLVEGSNNIFYQNTMLNCYQINVNSSNSIIAKNNVTAITVTGGSDSIICGNRITSGLGLCIGGHNNQFYGNELLNNYAEVEFYGNEEACSGNVLYNNNFISNSIDVQNLGKNRANFWNKGVKGNYWSSYTGSDSNGDGVGDSPYIIMSEAADDAQRKLVPIETGRDNYPLIALFDVSSVTVDLPSWVYVAPESLPATTFNPPSGDNSETAPPIQQSTQFLTSDTQRTVEYAIVGIIIAIGIILAAIFVLGKRKRRTVKRSTAI